MIHRPVFHIIILVWTLLSLSDTCFAQQTVKSRYEDRDIYLIDNKYYTVYVLDLLISKDCYENPNSPICIRFNFTCDSLGRVTKADVTRNACRNCNMDMVLSVCERIKSNTIFTWIPKYLRNNQDKITASENTVWSLRYIDPKTRMNTLFSPLENIACNINNPSIIKDESSLENAVMAIIDNTIGLNNAPIEQFFVFKTDSRGRICDIYTNADIPLLGGITTAIEIRDLSRICSKMRNGLRLDFIADIAGKKAFRYAYYTFTCRP